jgi:hypothetical protein
LPLSQQTTDCDPDRSIRIDPVFGIGNYIVLLYCYATKFKYKGPSAVLFPCTRALIWPPLGAALTSFENLDTE